MLQLPAMEQSIHLKHTVRKLDQALERLQEIQNTLRGHSPSLGVADLDTTLLHRLKSPQPRRFHELGSGAAVEQSAEDWRRWSTPATLVHDALSEVVAASTFAKKTMDMVKVQKKQASKTSWAKQEASLLHPSNRINFPQATMAAPDDASCKLRGKENRRNPHQSKIDSKDAPKLQTKAGARSSDRHLERRGKGRASSFTYVAPKEHHAMSSHMIRLRSLATVNDAAHESHGTDDQGDSWSCSIRQHDEQDDNMHQHYPIDQHHRQAAPPIMRSSSSMREMMQMEEKERGLSRLAAMQDKGKGTESPSSSLASKSFCVQLEEIKSSRKKSWGFSQGKASDNVVVMFPNPTYDDATPPASTPPHVKPAMDNSNIRQASFHQKAVTCPSIALTNQALSSGTRACPQKKEKIVRLSPCSMTSRARKPNLRPAPMSEVACARQGAPLKKQKWKYTLPHPPPTLIRRLPEAHEMTEVPRQDRGPSINSSLNFSVGRLPASTKKGCHEERYICADDGDDGDGDDDGNSKIMKKSWSFGNHSVVKSTPSNSNARRSSLGASQAGGSHAFSFLSKHFHAWRMASKEDP